MDDTITTYKPMYKVRPYFVIKKVKLPDCMYLLKPVHKLPSLGGIEETEDTQRALESIEQRQNTLFSQIKTLQQELIKTAEEKFGLAPNDLQNLIESYVPSNVPIDVVINCSPTNPPYAIIALYHYISTNVSTSIKSFVHSSAKNSIDTNLLSLFNTPPCKDDSKLKITIIWKKDADLNEPVMIVSPNKQVPIKGIANICRYLSREYCPQLYESLGPITSSQIDMWLDSVTLSYINGNAKEQMSVLRHMNSCLGSEEFLTGKSITLADIVIYSILVNQPSAKSRNNIKSWIKRCNSQEQLKSIPCYLN